MFNTIITTLQLRRSTAFLLERSDDHLLADIGLTREELEAMHLGLSLMDARTKVSKFHSLPAPRGFFAVARA